MRNLIIACVLVLFTNTGGYQQPSTPLQLHAPTTITAGAAWQVEVEGTPDNAVQLSLLTGLQVLSTHITLDSDGAGVWQIEPDRIINSGIALLNASDEELQATLTLNVRPSVIQELDLLTASNTIRAYGEGQAQLMVLGVDQWGNPVNQRLSQIVTYPQSTPRTHRVTLHNGFGWWWLQSHGVPGSISVNVTSRSLIIQQTAGTPALLSLGLSTNCIPLGTPTILVISAEARDTYGQVVPDGTQLHLTWTGGGQGWGSTIQGRTLLSVPSPTQRGLYRFAISSDNYRSEGHWLHVGVCHEP